MPCEEFEERLLEYDQLSAAERSAVDVHNQQCADCRGFLSALDTVDQTLTAAFSDRAVSPDFDAAVLQKLPRTAPLRPPSIVPEILDVVGWAAVIAIVLGLAMFFVPGLDFSTSLAATVGTVLLTAGFWTAYRGYTEIDRRRIT